MKRNTSHCKDNKKVKHSEWLQACQEEGASTCPHGW